MSSYVLLVDDDAFFAQACRKTLVQSGYKTDWADSAERAHHHILLHPRRYGLILLDLRMPDIGGRHLLKSLRDASVTTPIIIVTSNARAASRASMKRAGACAYIVKPFSSEVLLSAVRSAAAL
jgi:DNA-binding response OmpR family regulator